MRFGWLAGAALTFTIVAGCSSHRPDSASEPIGSSTSAIQQGTDDTADTYVVGVCIGGGPGGCQGFCSGALILPNVVVTARHCVSQLPNENVDCKTQPQFGGYAASSFAVTTSANMFQGSTGWHDVKSIALPTDSHVCGNDIALLVLNDLVPSSEAKPIIPGVQYPMGDNTRYVQQFEAIGYGSTDPDRQAANGVGHRRIHKNINVACIPGDANIDCPSGLVPDILAQNEFIAGNGAVLEAFACPGDSGSSAFDTTTYVKGAPVSYGVLSRGGECMGAGQGCTAQGPPCCDGKACPASGTCTGSDPANYCIQNTYTRLDAWRDLVVNTANQASNNWTLYPKPVPDWTIFVPIPGQDAGVDGSKGPGSGALGDPCTGPKDCSTSVCIDPGSGTTICSQACSDSTPCPDGFNCNSNLCVPNDPTPDAGSTADSSTTTTSGCALAPRTSGASPVGWLVALGLGLAASRRRRSQK